MDPTQIKSKEARGHLMFLQSSSVRVAKIPCWFRVVSEDGPLVLTWSDGTTPLLHRCQIMTITMISGDGISGVGCDIQEGRKNFL